MREPISHRFPPAGRGPAAWAPLVLAGFLITSPASALEGSIDVSDSHQTARSGSLSIDTFTRRDALSVGQRISLGPRVFFDTRLRSLREVAGTKVDSVRLETERITHQPSFLIDYGGTWMRAGISGSWLDRRVSADVGSIPDQTRGQLGAALRLDPTRSTSLNGLWNRSVTEQEATQTEAAGESRETSLVLSANQALIHSWEADYRFSSRTSNLVERARRQLLQTHAVELSGNPELVDDRVRSTWRARSQFFHQEVETGGSPESRVLLVPISAGLTLDDTPETLDPLEEDPVPVPGLLDGDLDEPTPVDLGDLAPVVREFGGDYRNLQFDLGEPTELAGAVIYVDTRLLLPQLFEWRVFFTSDPEGRNWTEAGPTEVSVAYTEFGGIRQGWEARFSRPLVARHVKFVDVKLGTTIPQLLVTEVELYRVEAIDPAGQTAEDSQTHRIDGSLSLDLTSAVRLDLSSSLRQRTFEDEAADLDEVSHGIQPSWRRGPLLLSGRYGIHRLWSDSRSNTDIVDYGITARRTLGASLSTTLSWTRVDDHSAGLDRTTEGLSFLALYRPTRRLHLSQTLMRSDRTDRELAVDATSYVASTSLRGSPVPNLSFDLDRTDRWVDQEAGSGFVTYHDTALTASWNPVPLVALSSNVAYQEHLTNDWIVRNSAGWTPFPGARTELQFSANSFSDTRTDNTRYSAQAAVRWRAHTRVVVDGSIETSRVEIAGETSTPVSTLVHLLWSF